MRNAALHRIRMVSGSATSPGSAGSGLQWEPELRAAARSQPQPTASLGCAFALAPAFQVAEHLVGIEQKIMCSNCLEMVNNGHLDQLPAACSGRLWVCTCRLYIQKLALRKFSGKLK